MYVGWAADGGGKGGRGGQRLYRLMGGIDLPAGGRCEG